jgi:transposase-like protein
MNQTPVKVRRQFDETFKREAVQNWLNSGKSAPVIARELGLLANRLYAWRKRFAPADAGGGWRRGQSPARPPIFKLNWTPPGAKSLGSPNNGTY